MAESVELRYTGTAPFVSMLAQMLEDEGLAVVYEPPMEERGLDQGLVVVILYVSMKVVDKTIDMVLDRVLGAFKKRVPKAEVTVDRRDTSNDGSE
jgi:hypothetical protein